MTAASTTLKDLKPGQRAKVTNVRTAGGVKRRVIEMGLTVGSIVEVERVAPLGDPIGIKVKGFRLSLRKEEAQGVDVELF
ncbi:MAG: ferrous iron transport protein A [Myxococcales bacterium]|nr:MAG: ferrous iron transport protein A [Myxococcales bacterium]